MAKKITRKRTRKTVKYNMEYVFADGTKENVVVNTEKKCVGNPILADKKCQLCIGHPTSSCALVCFHKAELDKPKKVKVKVKAKAGKRVSKQPWETVFTMLSENTSPKTVKILLIKEFSSEGAAKSFVSTCSSAYNAVTKGGNSKMAKYAEWLKNEKSGDSPDIMPKSKKFVERAFSYVNA